MQHPLHSSLALRIIILHFCISCSGTQSNLSTIGVNGVDWLDEIITKCVIFPRTPLPAQRMGYQTTRQPGLVSFVVLCCASSIFSTKGHNNYFNEWVWSGRLVLVSVLVNRISFQIGSLCCVSRTSKQCCLLVPSKWYTGS